MGIPRHMLAHHHHPRTEIYVTIHKAKIPTDVIMRAARMETLEGITVSAAVGVVCCLVSGESSPSSPRCV